VIEYFKQVAGAIHIPVMVQDAPLSPTPLPVSLLIDLVRQVPQVQYAKIEVPQAASDRTRAPLGPVSPRTRRGLIALAAQRNPLIMHWAR
jgi:dihydrodipicolinate synthase/N-acetylneuraminate lyase